MDMPVASLFVSSCGLKVAGGERSRGQHVIFDLFPCTISLSLYIPFTWCHAWIAPWPPNPPPTPTTTINLPTNSILLFPPRLPVPPDAVAAAAPEHSPLFPPVVSWPADGGLGAKTAEQQPDAGTECEGRRGRAPDLSEWGRPAREMYSLPLLYRNPSPYEYYSIEHLHDMGVPDDDDDDDALLERSSL